MSRKTSGIAVLTVALALALSACAAQSGGSSADEPVELTFANWQWLEPGRGELLWEAMLEFEESHSNVTLKRQDLTRANYDSTIQTQIGAGEGPDILIVPPSMFPTMTDANLLVPIADLPDYPGAAGETVDGERVAYTWSTATFGFFWNEAILAEAGVQPPTTMDELLAAAEQITAATGKPGFAVRSSLSEEGPWWSDFANWVYGYGGAWSDGTNLTINDPMNIEAVAMLKRLYDAGVMPIGDDASTFRSRFANGEIGMMFDNSAVLYTILEGPLESADVGVSTLPFPTSNSSRVTNFVGVNANSSHPDEASEFVRWLASDDGQEVLAAALFPGLTATGASAPADVEAEYPWIVHYQEQATTATGSPVVAGFELETPQIQSIVMSAIENVLINDVDPADALSDAQAAAESSLG